MRHKKICGDDLDIAIGLRIKRKRMELELKQEDVAKNMGYTAQQIQKYETGANRLSASNLFKMSKFFKTNVMWFFDGLEEDSNSLDFFSKQFGDKNKINLLDLKLLTQYNRLESQAVKNKIHLFVKNIADILQKNIEEKEREKKEEDIFIGLEEGGLKNG